MIKIIFFFLGNRHSFSDSIIRQHQQLAEPTAETERDELSAERILNFMIATCRRLLYISITSFTEQMLALNYKIPVYIQESVALPKISESSLC